MPYNQKTPDFNEYMFGMYLTFEVLESLRADDDLDGIALSPSLQEEADLGYDMKIPRKSAMLYLQFKLPELMRKSNASEWGTFGDQYLRFTVKTDATTNGNIQHNVLCALEDSGEHVFYAAPAFMTMNEITEYVNEKTVCDNSVFPRPSALGPVQPDSTHRFAYIDADNVHAFSEPKPAGDSNYDPLLNKLRSSVREAERIPVEEFLGRESSLLSVHIGHTPESDNVVQRVIETSSAVGLQPILVTESE